MADNDLGGILGTIYNNYASSMGTATSEKNIASSLDSNDYLKYVHESMQDIKLKKPDEKAMLDNLASVYTNHNKLVNQHEIKLAEQRIKNSQEIYSLNKNNLENYTKLSQDLADVYENIAKNNKATLGDLAQIYTLEKEKAKQQKNTIEYQKQQFEKGVNTVKQAFGTIIQHIMNYINDWDNLMRWNQWEKGITDSGSQYEQNFTEIAARNGSSIQMETHTLIGDTLDKVVNDSVLSKGLNFNNEVFPAITEAVQKGFMGEEAIEVAIDNAIDKKVAPWLDTSSETWVNLQYQLSDDMLAQLKGQQLLLQETREGNRILQNGVVSALLDELAPTLLNIDANTTDVTDLSGQAQSIVASLMANGYSKQDAVKVANQTIDAYQNPFNNLSGNSSTWQKLLAIGGLQGNDLAGAMNFATGAISPFNNGTWQAGGAVAANLGVPTNGFTRNTDYIEDLLNAAEAANDYSKRGDLSTIYNMKVADINELTTATQQNDNLKQNKAADSVFDKNLTTHGIDLAVLQLKEVKEIKTWLITGLTVLLLTKLTDKMTDGFIKNVLSKFKGGGSGDTSSSGGILKNFFTGGKGKSGFTKALNSKASGAALVTGGLLVAKEGFNELNESDTILKDKTASDIQKENAKKGETTSKIAIGAGAGAAVAGTASLLGAGAAAGPIGWIALAVGGAALAVDKFRDHMAELDDATAHITRSFNESKQTIENEANAREDQLFAIQNNITSLETTDEKLEYLQKNGINTTQIALDLQGKSTTEVNKELEKYLDNLIKQNEQNSEDAQTLIDDVAADFKNDFNDNVDKVKEEILKNYSSEALKAKGFSGDDIWINQKKALKKLGYSDAELDGLYYHWKNGAADKEELSDFLDSGAIQGDNLGSFENRIEDGKVDADKVNYVLRQVGVNDIKLLDAEEISRILGSLATDIDYLDKMQAYGREDNKVKSNIPLDFNQEKYDTAKQNVLNAREDSKDIIQAAFENLGHPDAMSNWPDDLKGFDIGSPSIPYDMIAMVHHNERILTAEQNKKYTEDLVSGHSTNSIIQASVQDLILAIKNQTNEIINYLSTMSFNNSSFISPAVNMSTEMGNTKVLL